VPAVLLDEIAQKAPQAGVLAGVVAGVDELVDSALGQGSAEAGSGPEDSSIPILI
jgi:hypothetical protein